MTLLVIFANHQTVADSTLNSSVTHFASSSTTSVNAVIAASITSDALAEAKHILRSAYETSITQANVTHHLETMMRSEGASSILAFPSLVMSGDELTLPHGDPLDDDTHIINPSTEPLVMIDIGCKYLGHCSDVTRTFFFESATQEMKNAYSDVLAAEEAIIEAIGPGVLISDLDAIMRTHLSDYYGRDNVTVLTYWGHGVGRYVHEYPILYNVDEELVVDEVLAIEPGLYFDDGWAVRVEDTVLVTETGVEVLSNASKALEDVTIHHAQPFVEADLTFTNYDYGLTPTASLSVIDSALRTISSVDFFDGYSWTPMTQDSDHEFSLTYPLDTSYSSLIRSMVRIQFENDTYYFNRLVSSEAVASSSVVLEPSIQINSENLLPDYPLFWTIAQAGAKMIRVRFEVIDGGLDQFLIKDAASRLVIDYRHVHERFLWTPWIASDELIIHIVSTEPIYLGGVDDFRFTIDMMEYIDEEIQPPTSTTTETTTPTSSFTQSPTPSYTSPTTTSTQDTTTPVKGNPVGQALITMSGVAIAIIIVGVVLMRGKQP